MVQNYSFPFEQQNSIAQFKSKTLPSLEKLLQISKEKSQLQLLQILQKVIPQSQLYLGFYSHLKSETPEVPIYLLKNQDFLLTIISNKILIENNTHGIQSEIIPQRRYQ